jgi:hypothetical protein
MNNNRTLGAIRWTRDMELSYIRARLGGGYLEQMVDRLSRGESFVVFVMQRLNWDQEGGVVLKD